MVKAVAAQNEVIQHLNAYLHWHNLPLRLNQAGVCNGLSMLHAKYFIEGREEAFFNFLNRIVEKRPSQEIDLEINHFVTEIFLTQDPSVLDKTLRQRDAHKMLASQSPLEPVFRISVVSDCHHWENIFNQLGLDENEILVIKSINHAVNIIKKNGQYVLYNPSSGLNEFPNEQSLIAHLHQKAFFHESTHLGMHVELLGQRLITRSLPDSKKLYTQYLSVDTVDNEARCRPVYSVKRNRIEIHSYTTLDLAVVNNNTEAVVEALGLGAARINEALFIAIKANAYEVFKHLLSSTSELEPLLVKKLIECALQSGANECFGLLFQNELVQQVMNEQRELLPWIDFAVRGGNGDLLKKLLEYYEITNGQLALIIKPINVQDVILTAINSGSIESLILLLDKAKPELSETQSLNYLLHLLAENDANVIFSSKLLECFPLMEKQSILTFFFAALKKGRGDFVEALIDNEHYSSNLKSALKETENEKRCAFLAVTSPIGSQVLKKLEERLNIKIAPSTFLPKLDEFQSPKRFFNRIKQSLEETAQLKEEYFLNGEGKSWDLFSILSFLKPFTDYLMRLWAKPSHTQGFKEQMSTLQQELDEIIDKKDNDKLNLS
ncbi:hypothetical protein [Legionella sp. km772]|uniref:hypothetical protein n=1 Tax=Legionella sp. km772 TaxID=2498111 RepID=UPI000F8EABAD|nr:hypothetical protein [Legionella sp. km772]RUR10080.1 hypothetical protein ELY15_08505 [Legionella sp. km772]